MQDFLRVMQERGFIHQCTDQAGLEAAMKQPITAYIGFDCTAPSLHVGSLMQIMVLRWLQKCGHRPIVLMGGGTTKVGDPSGKDEARKLLDDAGIAANMNGIKQVFKKFLSFDGDGGNALMINNDDWLSELSYIKFLRDYGKYFSVNRMMSMDSVKLRLDREQNLSFLEFNYMILQAYDFVELNSLYNCRLQIGGSDQWGNIVMGIDLASKISVHEKNHKLVIAKLKQIPEFADYLKKNGSKSDFIFDNSVTNDFENFQINFEAVKKLDVSNLKSSSSEAKKDALAKVGKLGTSIKGMNSYLQLFNEIIEEGLLPSDLFQELMCELNARHSKEEAFGLTTPLITTSSGAKMGKTANGAVWLNADALSPYDYWQFWRNTEDGDVERFLKFFTELTLDEIARITADKSGAGINEAKKILANEATALCHGKDAALAAAETARKTFEEGGMGGALPEHTISKAELGTFKINTALVHFGFAESNGDAKKLVSGGGVKLNDKPVADANYALTESDFVDGVAKLSKGKKHHAKIILG